MKRKVLKPSVVIKKIRVVSNNIQKTSRYCRLYELLFPDAEVSISNIPKDKIENQNIEEILDFLKKRE